MKQLFITSVFSFVFLISCGQTINSDSNKSQPTIQLSEKEKSILDTLGIDAAILTMVRTYTDSSIYILSTNFNFYVDSLNKVETIVKNYNGFSFKADQNKAREIVFGLKDNLKTKGYLIYISEANFGYNPDEVSILKATDQFEILFIEETNGINYDIENKDVIAKLQEWNKLYPFQIISAGFDWVEAVFIKKPDNMKNFAKEVYDFCPDIVDQGAGSVKNLYKEMDRLGILYLWWD